jgi:hypothetical protein
MRRCYYWNRPTEQKLINVYAYNVKKRFIYQYWSKFYKMSVLISLHVRRIKRATNTRMCRMNTHVSSFSLPHIFLVCYVRIWLHERWYSFGNCILVWDPINRTNGSKLWVLVSYSLWNILTQGIKDWEASRGTEMKDIHMFTTYSPFTVSSAGGWR